MPIATYRHAFVIYNRSARGLDRLGTEQIDIAIGALREDGHDVTYVATRGPGSAIDIARECVRQGADLILTAGGDGTVNEAANGAIHAAVPLGVLPAGTANILANELGITGPIEAVARQVKDWVPRRISVGRLTADGGASRRYFLMVAGVGLDAHILVQVDPEVKRAQGKVAFWLAGLAQLSQELEEFDVCVDGAKRLATFALASRVRNYGGSFTITREAGLLRDDFAFALFEGRSPFRYLGYLGGVLANTLDRTEGVTLLHGTAAEFHPRDSAPVYVEVDGELAGALPATVEIVPDALTLLVPPAFLSWTT